ncbi:Six-hairpin glycosidase [Aspergillus karnatakaensis]|uniref:glycoside hydrolase family 88 protein n=1 Tax=Aspergillus karnatakaensis TaxID=1810916 RepID=UPI003CCDA775
MGSIGELPVFRRPKEGLPELFAENIIAKILRTATERLVENNPPSRFPEVVPQDGPSAGLYRSRDISFWTCGFFPGCIYSLLERLVKHPSSVKFSAEKGKTLAAIRTRLEELGKSWSDPIHSQSCLTNTHDMGFIMMPHMRPRWELYHDEAALQSIVTSARNLTTRFNPAVRAIRSWDEDIYALVTSGRGKPGNYIVIIDSMCNLDLLFYAAAQTGETWLADIAVTHAQTLLTSHLRPEPSKSQEGFSETMYSTYHVVNFNPATGAIDERLTAQGYSSTSTWSRGQAWGILGYAQTYNWTGKAEFLDAACGLAEYFLYKLETAPDCVEFEVESAEGLRKVGRYVPIWDFAAPVEEYSPPLRDTSAGVAAANGLLLLSQALLAQREDVLSARYREAALRIVEETLAYSLSKEKAKISWGSDGKITGVGSQSTSKFEAILRNATVSNNAEGVQQIRDHGLVYADYYLIEFGTRLLGLGLA